MTRLHTVVPVEGLHHSVVSVPRQHQVVTVLPPTPPVPYFVVDPSSRFTWEHNWEDWLYQGESIVSRQWTITPSATLSNASTKLVAVEGLLPGTIHHLTERVTNSSGVSAERTITLRARQTLMYSIGAGYP